MNRLELDRKKCMMNQYTKTCGRTGTVAGVTAGVALKITRDTKSFLRTLGSETYLYNDADMIISGDI